MSRMLGSMIILAILFGMLYPSTIVHEAKAFSTDRTIYIRADGSIDPSTAPIQRNGDIYTLTDDLSVSTMVSTLVIERSNMTLDGAGHSVFYSGTALFYGSTVMVVGMSNVTIMNLNITKTNVECCIYLSSCLNITLTGNVLEPWWWEPSEPPVIYGGEDIELVDTSNSTIVENSITLGIYFNASNYNHIFHNNFRFLPNGHGPYDVLQNSVSGNNFWDDGYPSGGNFWGMHTPRINPGDTGTIDPTAVDVFSGPYQNESGSDGIVDMPVTLSAGNVDHYPLIIPRLPYAFPPDARFLVWSSEPLPGGEAVNFDASTSTPGWNGTQVMLISEYLWDFGDGNVTSIVPPFSTVYPIVFHAYQSPGTFKVTLTVVDREGMNSSTSQTVDVTMAALISISTTSPSSLAGYKVVISGRLYNGWGESLKDETVVLSYIFGGIEDWIPITSATTDSLGNYQAVWIPTASGSFTVKISWPGNSTCLGAINSTTLSSLAYGSQYIFTVESTSTIQELAFNATNRELSFTAAGSNGTQGYARVTVPRSLVGDSKSIKAYVDNGPTSCGITSNNDSYVLTLSYTHSTHTVTINLGSMSTPLIDTPLGKLVAYGIPITAIITVIIVYAMRKKHRNHQ